MELVEKQLRRLFSVVPDECAEDIAKALEQAYVDVAQTKGDKSVWGARVKSFEHMFRPNSISDLKDSESMQESLSEKRAAANSANKFKDAFVVGDTLDEKSVKNYGKLVDSIINAVLVTEAGLDSAIEEQQKGISSQIQSHL